MGGTQYLFCVFETGFHGSQAGFKVAVEPFEVITCHPSFTVCSRAPILLCLEALDMNSHDLPSFPTNQSLCYLKVHTPSRQRLRETGRTCPGLHRQMSDMTLEPHGSSPEAALASTLSYRCLGGGRACGACRREGAWQGALPPGSCACRRVAVRTKDNRW